MAAESLCDEDLIRKIREVLHEDTRLCASGNREDGDAIKPGSSQVDVRGNKAVMETSKRFKTTSGGDAPAVTPSPSSSGNDLDKKPVDFGSLLTHAEDFKQFDEGSEMAKDKADGSYEMEKVYITKTEKNHLEDIGKLAAKTRVPLDDKQQRYFEKDRKKFAGKIVMPETQELSKNSPVPHSIITKTKELPSNITSTELDGLRSYLLQLKDLISRRETAWARTTERDYNQRVEITRFKNEVSHLRMLCEKRQRDLKEKDQAIASKDDEIRDLNKRIQSLKSTLVKMERRDENVQDNSDDALQSTVNNTGPRNIPAQLPRFTLKSYTPETETKDVAKRRIKAMTPRNAKSNVNSSDEAKLRLSHSRSKRDSESADRLARGEDDGARGGQKKGGSKVWKASANLKNQATSDMDASFERKMNTSTSRMRQQMISALVSQAGKSNSRGAGLTAGGTASLLAKALHDSRNMSSVYN